MKPGIVAGVPQLRGRPPAFRDVAHPIASGVRAAEVV